MANSGGGVYLYDESNFRYLDACGGAAVSCLGHSHPAPIKAIQQQVAKLAYVHSGFFTSDVAEKLADKLVEISPGNMNHVWFASGGSEAVESALKLARQYCVDRGEPGRRHFISRRQSFHGNTLGALSVSGNEFRKKPYYPILTPSKQIAPCYPFRDKREDETEQEYGLRAANELERKIIEFGPETVIGFIAETVGGATAGVLPPVSGYLQRIREICDQYDILLILDEVMCGMGRTGSYFSCSEYGVVPDIATIAKGLGAGYQPIGAMLCTDAVYTVVKEGSGFFKHGHTYMGHAVACAASLAVLETIENENLLENVKLTGNYLLNNLRTHLGDHPFVGDIRGQGLFVGIEFVFDKETKEPLHPNYNFHKVLKNVAQRNGLLCYPGGGTIDGERGDHVLLAPAYIVNETIVDEIISLLASSIDESLIESGITVRAA